MLAQGVGVSSATDENVVGDPRFVDQILRVNPSKLDAGSGVTYPPSM